MTVSLDSAFVAPCLQVLESLSGLVRRAEAHCAAQDLPAENLTDARLAPDMWPFAKQIFEAGHHSARAVTAVRAGVFSPELAPAPTDFPALHAELAESMATLRAVTPGELDSIASDETRFEFGSIRMDFSVEDFLLSFSMPNFFFHTTTAYAILRHHGLEIGKRDFLGKPRLKK